MEHQDNNINRTILVSDYELDNESSRIESPEGRRLNRSNSLENASDERVAKLEKSLIKLKIRLKQALIQLRLVDRPSNYRGPMHTLP